jgi:putative transposase
MWKSSKKSRWPAGHQAVELEGECFGVTVSGVCRKVGITRQNYYARRQERQRRKVDVGLVVALVVGERKIQPRLGGRKLHFLFKERLAKEGVKLGRDRFFEVLNQHGLLLEPKPTEYPCTTNSQHYLPVFGNRIKGLEASTPNEIWVEI